MKYTFVGAGLLILLSANSAHASVQFPLCRAEAQQNSINATESVAYDDCVYRLRWQRDRIPVATMPGTPNVSPRPETPAPTRTLQTQAPAQTQTAVRADGFEDPVAYTGRLKRLAGKTLLAATATGKPWQIFLGENGNFEQRHSDGDQTKGRWTVAGKDRICLTYSNGDHACREMVPVGRGWHWKAPGQVEASSYILTVADGNSRVDRYQLDFGLGGERAVRLFGRTKLDKEIWYLDLSAGNRFQMTWPSGRTATGTYSQTVDGLCLEFQSGRLDCRHLARDSRGGLPEWQPTGGHAESSVVAAIGWPGFGGTLDTALQN